MPIVLKPLTRLLLAAAMVFPGGQAWSQTPPSGTSTPSEAEVEEAGRIAAEALRLFQAGRVADAVPLAERLLRSTEGWLGPDHPDTLSFAQFLGQLYNAQGRYAAAEPLYRRVLLGRERALGGSHAQTIASLDDLSRLYVAEGRHADAEPLSRRGLVASETTLGRDHLQTIGFRNQVCLISRALGRLSEAASLCRLALGESERVLGPDHRLTLLAANNLATLHQDQGRYAEAEPLFRRAWEVSRKAVGEEDGLTLTFAHNLAILYGLQGRYDEAEQLLRGSLEVRERVLGRRHRQTALAAITLADSYQEQGRYTEAELLYERALSDGEELFGPNDPIFLTALNNFGTLYRNQGRFADAEPLYRRVLEAREQSLGPDHRHTLLSLAQLATLYQDQGRQQEAEPLYRRALKGAEEVLGPDHPETQGILANLAHLLLEEERYGEAEPLMRRSLETRERVLGREHPTTLIAVSNLAVLHDHQGRFAEAEVLHRRALTVRERVLGLPHPDTLLSLENNLAARLKSGRGAPDILALARRYLAAQRERRRQGQSEQRMRNRQRDQRSISRRFALFADSAWAATADDRGQRQVLLAEAFGALQDSLAGSADRAIAEQAAQRYASGRNPALLALIQERQRKQDEAIALNERLAQSFGGTGGGNSERPAALRRDLEVVQARIEAIDAQLQREAPDYFTLIQPRPVGVEAAQALLAPDEALLLVVPSIFGTHVVALTRDGIDWTRSEWEAEQVEAAIRRLRWDVGARVTGSPEELARLPGGRAADAPARYDRSTAHQLYNQLVQPVLLRLAGKTRLFVAAGGALSALPFSLLVSAAPTGADDDPAALRATRWFADDFQLTHIPSIQSLAILRQQQPQAPGSAFLGIGNPRLATTPAERRYGAMRGLPTAHQVFARGRTRQGAPADLAELRKMPSLPGTADELQRVRERLQAPPSALYMGDRATEAVVRRLDFSGTRLVLFATHGLTAEEAGGAGEAGLVLTPPPIAQAGPQDYLDVDPANDGYLAASEVTTLRMDADWVVLSACNTATGDEDASLSALARAFFYAGARNLLASHWPVSDEVAPLLISNTVAAEPGGLTRGEALQRAMREIRTNPDRPQWAHPFFWAPFVLIGDGSQPAR